MTTTIVLTFLILIVLVSVVALVIRARRRSWRAISPHGAVDLGTQNYHKALSLVAKVGKPSYVDHAQCIIFYDTQAGGAPPLLDGQARG